MGNLITVKDIEKRIYYIRGVKVMLDRDLAKLYGVATGNLNKAVTRNIDRFPADFMFRLNRAEFDDLKFHFGTSSWGGTRKLPRVFTEQGVAMLSSVLRSKRAIQVNVQIMRAFLKLRHMIVDHAELKRELAELRNQTDERFQIVFTVLDKLVSEEEESKIKIGFVEDKEKKGK